MLIDCNKCKHQETEVCEDCSVSYDMYAQCTCHINPPCGFCENCRFEEK